MSRVLRFHLGCVLLCVGLLGCSRSSAPTTQIEPELLDPQAVAELLGLMRERLDLMHAVARWKWNEKKAVEDLPREKALLDAMAKRAEERGIDPDLVRNFFEDQITAAKLIQTGDFGRWRSEGRGRWPDTEDLAQIRARIDRLNEGLLDALVALQGELDDPEMSDAIAACADEVLWDPSFPEDIGVVATWSTRMH